MIIRNKINSFWKNKNKNKTLKTLKTLKTKLKNKQFGGGAQPNVKNINLITRPLISKSSSRTSRKSTSRTSTSRKSSEKLTRTTRSSKNNNSRLNNTILSQTSNVIQSINKKPKDETNSSFFLKMVKDIAENKETENNDVKDKIISFAKFVNINLAIAAQSKVLSHRSNIKNETQTTINNFKKAIEIINRVISSDIVNALISSEYFNDTNYVYLFDMANLGESYDRLLTLIAKIIEFDVLPTNKLFIIVLHNQINIYEHSEFPEISVHNTNIIVINPQCENKCETDDFIIQILFQYFYFVADFNKTPDNILIISNDRFNWKEEPYCKKGNPILNKKKKNKKILIIDSIPHYKSYYLANFKASLKDKEVPEIFFF